MPIEPRTYVARAEWDADEGVHKVTFPDVSKLPIELGPRELQGDEVSAEAVRESLAHMLREYCWAGEPLPATYYKGEDGLGIRNFPVTITQEDLERGRSAEDIL